MKKRTLNQTWTLCLRMWRWIAKEYDGTIKVSRLKQIWLKNNGFTALEVQGSCFFCDFSINPLTLPNNTCNECPGRLVDSGFGCGNSAYDYEYKPVEFYKELLRLNRIRKAKK